MQRFSLSLSASLILIILAFGIFSCSSDSDNPTGPGDTVEPNWPENALGLPEIDDAALDSSGAIFIGLLDSLEITAARYRLVDYLPDRFDAIDWVKLGPDSTTVCIEFTDGATAMIFTEELFGQEPAPQGGGSVLDDLRKTESSPERTVAQKILHGVSCGDIVMPVGKKVKIVNAAGATNPVFSNYIEEIRQALIYLGWPDSEIEIKERKGLDDKSFIPDDMLLTQGYGLIIYVAHGGIWEGLNDGLRHFHMQCFKGGKYEDGFADYVTEERWELYKQWYRNEHRLVTAYSYADPDSQLIKEVYIRDDLFGEQLQIDSGVFISFMSCNSWQLDDELSARETGAVLSWDGCTNAYDATLSLRSLLYNMAGGITRTDVGALAQVYTDGYGTSTGHHGEDTYFKATDITGDFYLPGWGTITANTGNFPPGTNQISVRFSYDDCPAESLSFVMTPGETIEVEGLIPGETTVTVIARDASNNTIGAGNNSEEITSGLNEITIATCETELAGAVTYYPSEADGTVDNIEYTITYNDPTIDPVIGSYPPTSIPTITDLIPLNAIMTTVAYDDATILATSTDTLDLNCNSSDVAICYGWLTLEAGDMIDGVTTLTVTVDSGGANAPSPVSFSVDSSKNMFGFETGETVYLSVEAFDQYGSSQGATTVAATVEGGQNIVTIDITVYAILLEATPHSVAPDGSSYATITATVKGWNEGDLTEPTGDPVVDKLVEFDASCGTFVGGITSGTTDANGQVILQLTSDAACLAEIHAFNTADQAESRAAYVNFGQKMSFWVNGNSSDVTGPTTQGSFDASCVLLQFYFRGQFITEKEIGEGKSYGLYCPFWAEPGDEIRLDFTPINEIDYCSDGLSSFGPIYLHTVYENDFDHQKTYLMSGEVTGFSGTTSVSVTLEEIDYYK
ncbi:MAG: hypothetical protein R3F48_17305 [Candidatus Zixiibacteriota bacterium]